MDNTTLGINAAGNPVLFNNDFLAMLKDAPVSTVLVADTDDDPGPSGSGATTSDDTASVPLVAELTGLTGDKRALNFITCLRNAFESPNDDVQERWQQAADELMNEAIDTACPSVKERRDRIEKLYLSYAYSQNPQLDIFKYWEEETFRKYLPGFLIAMSISDIFNYEGQFFIIKESFRNQPLFIERTERGMGLVEGNPASATGMTASFRALGKYAGFPVTNYHALRRDSGTVYGLIFGAYGAQQIMGHKEADSTYFTNYSKGVSSIPITEARLGLLDHTLTLPQRIGLQRHRQEGRAAYALLNAGFKFQPIPQESSDELANDRPEGAPVEQAVAEPEPKPSKPEKKKGTRGNPIIELTEQQEAEIQSHVLVKPLVDELEGYWDEIYTLFPAKAMTSHGARTAEKVSGMRQKYSDDPICQENAERIAELAELIRQTQKEKNTRASRQRRKVRAQIQKEMDGAEAANPIVHSTEEVKKARNHAEEMARVVNLPKPSEQLKALGNIRDMPHFGEGLLSEECRKLLSRADIIDKLREDEENEENEREDRLANEEDNEGQTAFTFKDVDDLKILDADLVKTKIHFLSGIAEPLVVEQIYEQLTKEYNGELPCLLCEALPEEHRPRVFGNKLGQTRFKDRVRLHRHEELVHTPWFDLIQYMLTDDPNNFKCPTEGCSFRQVGVTKYWFWLTLGNSEKSIDNVREHCVTDCEEKELYQSLERKHEEEQERKRQAKPSREKLRREKDEQRLRGPGLKLHENIFKGTKKISETSPEEALELASNYDFPEDEILPHLRGLAAMNERARTSINEEGIIKDPHVKMPMEKISKSILTPELNDKINARLAKK
ncbi:unnamed protein product [Rhizoctonia solani]|uniref:Uncharacterized protein n=1 Tax=Rhizoctonia solani TaxID=456999 RepID=A0A8H3C212_9AGAM|nr:unnamed protein product [Rhizoctonia solani]